MKATSQQNEFLRRGDTVQLQGTVGVAFRISDSGAACYDLLHPSKVHHIAGAVPRALILSRGGEDGLKDFEHKHKLGKQQPTTQEPETEDDMKKYATPEAAKAAKKAADKARYETKKKAKSPAAKAAAFIAKDQPEAKEEAKEEAKAKPAKAKSVDGVEKSRGKLGNLFGHSVRSAIMGAAKAGAQFDGVEALLKKEGIEVPDGIVKRMLVGGRKVGGATLTSEQLKAFGIL